MNIHEYQAKSVLKGYGVPVLDGGIAVSPDQAEAVAKDLSSNEESPIWVVKAQIHAGGRGKAGGVKLAKSLSEVKEYAKGMIGTTLVTHQTGPAGKEVLKVYIEKGCNIANEYYVAYLVDRATDSISLIYSSEGGMDIEQVAAETPDKIKSLSINAITGLMPFQCRQVAFDLGLNGKAVSAMTKTLMKLFTAFKEKDAEMLEINPLVLTQENTVVVLDAKMSFDSNALYRHPEILELRDLTEEDPAEVEASKYDLAFIKLDGNIGCLVNGAGLAMATMDIIKLCGSEPANFLDVGGGATKEKVTEAFKIILKDPNVKGILVNIFGGIMKCDIIAEGVVAATKTLGLDVPLVVRLRGTNVDKGRKILSESGLNIIPAVTLKEAAEKIVEAVKA